MNKIVIFLLAISSPCFSQSSFSQKESVAKCDSLKNAYKRDKTKDNTVSVFSEKHIKGQLTDGYNPVPFATISLHTAQDSVLVAGDISNEQGVFEISLPDTDKPLLLRVSCVGYTTLWMRADKSDLGTIVLMPEAAELREVVVKAYRKMLSGSNGQLMLNVAGTNLQNIGKATDVIKYVPGVIVANNKYEIFGKGEPDIYIDKRKIRSKTELSLLNSANIKSVRLITNPGAEYDAGTRSVILITTLRRQDNGMSSIVNMQASRHKNWSNSEDVSFNLHHNALDLFATYQNDITRGDIKYNMDQTDYQSAVFNKLSASHYSDRTIMHDYNVGLNYNIGKSGAVGIKYIGTTMRYKILDAPYDYIQVYKDNALLNYTDNRSQESEREQFHNVTLYYTRSFTDRFQLQVDGDYAYSRLLNAQTITERSRISASTDTTNMRNVYKNRVIALKSVLSYALAKMHNFDFGLDFSRLTSWGTSENAEKKIAGSQYTDRETKYAGFLTYHFGFGRWNGNVGMRYEYVSAKNQENDEVKYKDTYSDILPSFALSASFGKWAAGINFSSKINRPSFRQLNNSVNYNNQYHYERGNSYLKPQYAYDTELNINYKFVGLKLNYQYIKDYIHPTVISVNEESGTVAWTTANASKFQQMGMTCVLSPVFGRWRPVLTAGIYKPFLTLPFRDKQVRYNHPYSMVSFQNSVEIGKGWTVRSDLSVSLRGNHGIYEQQSYGSFDVMIQKTLLHDKLNLTLKGTDLFNWSALKDTKTVNFVVQQRKVNQYNRGLTLTVSYNLNSFKDKYKGNGAAESEINRF